jgi:hypothetical protein
MKHIGRFVLVTAALLAVALPAQSKDKKDKKAEDNSAGPPIRVCVAQIRNDARRSANLGLQRDRLIKDLSESKAPKKAADKRRIEAVAISVGSLPTGEALPRDERCDFTLYVTIAELRDASDFKSQREQMEDIARLPDTGSRHEAQSIARVEFSLLRRGSPTPVMENTVQGQENMVEDALLFQLMDRIAQRVNSGVREATASMRE